MANSGGFKYSFRRIAGIAAALIVVLLAALYFGRGPNQRAQSFIDRAADASAAAASTSAAGKRVERSSASAAAIHENAASAAPHSASSAAPTSDLDQQIGLRQKIAAADRLPVEASLLHEQSLELHSVKSLLKGDDFDGVFLEFQKQSQGDGFAAELSNLANDAFAKRLQAAAIDVEASNVVCGLRLCLANIRASSGAIDWSAFVDNWRGDPTTPASASMSHVAEQPDGGSQLRLIFSTDPGSRSFHVGPRPPSGG